MNEELMMRGIRRGEESLQHYGVKGMKWGVRKNPDKAANKAIKKLRKYEKQSDSLKTKAANKRIKGAEYEPNVSGLKSKSAKASLKASKYELKREQLMSKAQTARTVKGAVKANRKASKVERKRLKANIKADKYERKAFKKESKKEQKKRAADIRAAKYDKKALKKAEAGKKWAKEMNKYLSNQSYSNVSKEDIAYARSWLVSAFD